MSVEWGDEDRVADIIRLEMSERTIRGWVKALRQVREELFACASTYTRRGDMTASVRVLGMYSALAHLGAVLAESIGEGRD